MSALSRRDLAALAGWKVVEGGRRLVDGLGGAQVLAMLGARWGRRWSREAGEDPGALARWVERPGGGRFWFPSTPVGAAEWARRTCTPEDLRQADAVRRGEFDLLGSGPVPLGDAPTFRRDLYSGVDWPLRSIWRYPLLRGDGSDIRTVWETSRCYHFIPLARAYWHSGDRAYLDVFTAHVRAWIAHNPLGRGPNWASSMDLAIRAANWTVAAALFAPAPELEKALAGEMLGHLWSTGWFLARHMEWHPRYRNNHYIANAVGLVYLGTLFRDEPRGAQWLRRGARILETEIRRQVGVDGVSAEASLAYHRLVTELFTWGGALVRDNLAGGVSAEYEDRLRRMYAFIDAYVAPTDEAPMLGDADDGRLHALDAGSLRAPRRHRLGLASEHWPAARGRKDEDNGGGDPSARGAFPAGGFFVMRTAGDHLVVRCGPVGHWGAGSHDHNDQLSYELTLAGRRVVVDSGTYAYTRDLAARHAFRSTAAHSAVQLGDEEQNPIARDRPWRLLEERTHARCRRWETTAEGPLFEGEHYGYQHRRSRAVCRRTIRGSAPGRWEVVDEILGVESERVTWRLHLALGEVRPMPSNGGGGGEAGGAGPGGEGPVREFLLPGSPAVRLRVHLPRDFTLELTETYASDRYGERYLRPCIVARGAATLPIRLAVTFAAEAR